MKLRIILLFVVAVLAAVSVSAFRYYRSLDEQAGIGLTANVPSPQPLGTAVVWRVHSRFRPDRLFRFSVAARQRGPYTVTRDFSPSTTFSLTRLYQGRYFVRVTAKSSYAATTSRWTTSSFRLAPRTSGITPVVVGTRNPLVALFNAPACSVGTVRVLYRFGHASWSSSGSQRCDPLHERDFLIAGLQSHKTYELKDVVTEDGHLQSSQFVKYATRGITKIQLPNFTVLRESKRSNSANDEIVHMLTPVGSRKAGDPVGTTEDGQVNWYVSEPDLRNVWPVRMEPLPRSPIGSRVFLLGSDDQPSVGPVVGEDVLRTVDLAGDALQQTDIQELNAQLARRGDARVYGFSHEALPLPHQRVGLIAFSEKQVNGKPTLGDMIIVLNKNLQVVWTWNAFKHLDVNRTDPLRETCVGFPGWACPVPGSPHVFDWTHANGLSYSSKDGDLLVSLRNQDWVLKINYKYGRGDGRVLWRLGRQGDFQLQGAHGGGFPWFSHQHNAAYVGSSNDEIALFDNGNTRCAATSQCANRGQVYKLDKSRHRATLLLNVTLPCEGQTLGSAQRLSDGDYYFDCGHFSRSPRSSAREEEVAPNGSLLYELQDSEPAYRSYRATSIYSMP